MAQKSAEIILHLSSIDDSPYREEALYQTFQAGLREWRPLSMVDSALRLIIADKNNRIEYFVTWNTRDFADVCESRKIVLLD